MVFGMNSFLHSVLYIQAHSFPSCQNSNRYYTSRIGTKPRIFVGSEWERGFAGDYGECYPHTDTARFDGFIFFDCNK
jgi:hypothetical protein